VYEPRALRLTDGAELAYVDRGTGTPVLLVPGWTMSCEVFAHQIGGLGPEFRVVAFDPRGHGRSSRGTDGHDYLQQGRDVAAVIDALGLDAVHLVGWSYGALAAYAYVEQCGVERLRSVTAIDMTPRPLGAGAAGEWAEGDLALFLREYISPALADPVAFAHGFADWMVARPLETPEREWLAGMHLATERHVALSLQISALHCDFRALAASLAGRLPYANAVRADWAAAAHGWLDAHAPAAVAWDIPSHLGFWERPRDFNARLTRFLREGR
jgi:pimeloyl-ACP methyl ester carboxylesterase